MTAPARERLPTTRSSITHRVKIMDAALGEASLYLTAGLYEDGRIGELFARVGKQGTTLRGLLDTVAIQMSLLFQYQVPLDEIVKQFAGTRFEPMGTTDNADIPHCSSLIDYIVRWLRHMFPEGRYAGMPMRKEKD